MSKRPLIKQNHTARALAIKTLGFRSQQNLTNKDIAQALVAKGIVEFKGPIEKKKDVSRIFFCFMRSNGALPSLGQPSLKTPSENRKSPSTIAPEEAGFLTSWEWTTLRFKVLKKYGRRCMCCGATPEQGAIIHVDHVKPRSKYPELSLDAGNLQVLCLECNKGKGAWDETDFRIRICA